MQLLSLIGTYSLLLHNQNYSITALQCKCNIATTNIGEFLLVHELSGILLVAYHEAECLDLLEERRGPATVSNKMQSSAESDGDFEWEDCADNAQSDSQLETLPDAANLESSGEEEEQMGLSAYAVDNIPEEIMTCMIPR